MGLHAEHRPLVTQRFAFLAGAATVACGLTFQPAAAESCRQALAMGLDVSGSVDQLEWSLQLQGLAAALEDPSVQRAFLAMEGAPVWIMIYEWASADVQRDIIQWTRIGSSADIGTVVQALRAAPYRRYTRETGMGAAMIYGGTRLAERSKCWSRTLDVSADGVSNSGPHPKDVRLHAALRDVVINGLVVGSGSSVTTPETHALNLARLEQYFKGAVIKGPDAFVEHAYGFEDYSEAMRRKLLKELQTVAIGSLDVPPLADQ